MSPRKLLPLLAVFLAVVLAYVGLTWHQSKKEAQEAEAKRLFKVKAADITDITFKKGQQEVKLVRQGQEWRLAKPLETKADAGTMSSLLPILASLEQIRDLGETKDLKAFGLDKPDFIVEFTAQGQTHRVAFGKKTPGDMGHYILKDQEQRLLVVTPDNKDSLDLPVNQLRDKSLFSLKADQVKAVKVKIDGAQANLERTGHRTWRWVGREGFQVRWDRAETLLREILYAKAQDFVEDQPKEVSRFGLNRPTGEVRLILEKGDEALLLGSKKDSNTFALKIPNGPVVVVEPGVLQKITQAVAGLEDKRLWKGEIGAVHKVGWGTPPKLWVGVKEKDEFKVTGPDRQELMKSVAQLEVALLKLQELEVLRPLAGSPPAGEGGYVGELFDAQGKRLFRLEELKKSNQREVEVRFWRDEKPETAVVLKPLYDEWVREMNHLAGLTDPPKEPQQEGEPHK